MDLITAKVEAAKLSREKRTQVYVNLTDDEEVEISETAGKDVLHIFANGSEISEQGVGEQSETKTPVTKNKSTIKTKINMATKKSSKKPAKKLGKKVEAVKNTAPKSSGKTTGGQQTLTIKAIREKINKGFYALNKDGKNLTPKYLEGMADQTREMAVTFKPKVAN